MMKKPTAAKVTLLAAVCAAACVLAVFAALSVWPFGSGTVLTGDLNNQYICYNAQFRRSILAGEGVAFSYTKSLGGGLLGILAYYCASAFNVVYILLAPSAYPQAAGIVLFLKLVCASAAMAFWLSRRFGAHLRFVPAALGWGLCAYAVVYAQNIMWMDALVLLPLVCRGIDLVVERRRPFVYAAALGAALVSNFYIAYMVCVFSVLYFFFALIEARRGAQECVRAAVPFALGSLAAGGVSAFLWLPSMLDILGSKNVGAHGELAGAAFKFSEFFHRLMPFSFVWEDVQDGLPNVYGGALAVVLALAYFCAAGIPAREKIASGAMAGLLFVSMWSEAAMLAMHGFTAPVWFPYRNSFLFTFWLLFLAASMLARGRLTPGRAAVCAALGLAFLAACFFVRHVWYTATLFGAGALLCAAYAAGVLVWQFSRREKLRAAALCVCGVLCAGELAANAVFVMDQFEKYPKAGYDAFYSETSAALEALEALGASGRVEKAYCRGYNDPMLLGYNGISHFGSTQTIAVSGLLNALGYGSLNAYFYGSTAFSDSFLGISGLIGADEYDFTCLRGGVPAHFAEAGASGALTLYENPAAFPMGCFVPETAADAALTEDFSMADTFDVQQAWFEALGGEGALFTECAVDAPLGEFEGALDVSVTAAESGLLYLVLDSEEQRPVTLSGDVLEEGYFAGYPCGALHLGRVQKGQTARVALSAAWGLGDVSAARAVVLNEEALASLAAKLNAAAGETELTNASYTSRVSSAEGGLYWMNIPYEKGMVCTVDGQEADIEVLFGSLCGVRLDGGEHVVRVTFSAPGAGAGAAVSVLCAAALAAGWFILKRKGKRA